MYNLIKEKKTKEFIDVMIIMRINGFANIAIF